jgi:LmbE family N-acetylglucosaminyl deacetylase
MNEHLRDRILRKLETLSDERGYQVLDYTEFLESRYAERPAPSASTFTRLTDAIEDKLRAGKVSASAIAETVGFMNRAAGALNNALEAGRAAANEIVNQPQRPGVRPSPPPTNPASSPANDTPAPGSGEEKL